MKHESTIEVLRHLGILFASAYGTSEHLADHSIHPRQDSDHLFYSHTPLWDYENPAFTCPFSDPGTKPLFLTLPPQTKIEDALIHTRLLIFLGAVATPSLRKALNEPGTLILVFDITPQRVAQMTKDLGVEKLVGRMHIFLGSVDSFSPPLGMSLPCSLFQQGFPVFYTLPDKHLFPKNEVDTCVQLLEILFYRYILYPLAGQSNSRGLPLRPMTRGLFYDQQLHFYQNISAYVQHPDIGALRRSFFNETAILIAAGPDLQNQFDYLKQNRENAVLICVNTALRPILKAGIHPHFVIINDTSIDAGRSFIGLPRLKEVRLIGHALADLGGETFPHKYIFGSFLPELFGPRPSLRLHGSVITTALSFARHIGCKRCVLVGAQLCSDNPWSMSYSKDSIHDRTETYDDQLTNAFPQLIPVLDTQNDIRYTTLNFLDASQWFLDELQTLDIECINTCKKSILYNKKIIIDPNFYMNKSQNLHRRLRQTSQLKHKSINDKFICQLITSETENWKAIRSACTSLLILTGEKLINAGNDILRRFDQSNISYLVQRFEDFDNTRFHNDFFAESPQKKEKSLKYLLLYVERMASTFIETLEKHKFS